MSDSISTREATAVIRGYIYQFDATIVSILGLRRDEELTVEGIEDFDITDGNMADYFQCKYFAATKLTPATIRDAILPMLSEFLSLKQAIQKKRRYHLYGFFKDSSPGDTTLTMAELKACLVRRKHIKQPSGENSISVIKIQEELGAKDSDIKSFSKKLTIHFCSDYQQHKKEVVELLSSAFSVSLFEAREYLYPTALTLISKLATTSRLAARRIRRKHFINQLRPSRALIDTWLLREKGEAKFCRTLRKTYFSAQNIDAVHRFFVIEIPDNATNTEILELLYTLQRKWSSHRMRRKPNGERYAPYIYFRGIENDLLVTLKTALQQADIQFNDGYAFLGSSFCTQQLCTPQTYENQIALRIISSATDFSEALEKVQGMRSVFEFFVDSPMGEDIPFQHITIPVTTLSMISKVI